jgi:hypothetical protein
MKKLHQSPQAKAGRLTSSRAEKIAAVEGMRLSPRMARILKDAASKSLSGEESRALIKAQFAVKKSA